MDKLKFLLHCLAHWLGWNHGLPVTKYDKNGNLWVAFRCETCGKIQAPYIRRDGWPRRTSKKEDTSG